VKDAGIGQASETWESAKWWYEKMGGEGAFPNDTSTGPIPRIDPAFGKLVGLATIYCLTNAAIQYARTKELPKDYKDLLAGRIGGVDVYGKPLRVVPPAIVMKDALSLWAHGGWGYMRAKESDLLSGISEAINNEDFRHAMIHDPADPFWKQRYDDAAHILGSPIGISTYMRQKTEGESKAKAAFGLAGFSPAPSALDQTPLEKAIRKVEANKGGISAMAPKQRAKTDLEHAVLGALRSGDRKPLDEAVQEKKINHHEAKLLQHRARLTPLDDALSHLGIDDIKELLKTEGVTDAERRELQRGLRRKQERQFSWQQQGEPVGAAAP